jgi:hypothetical protein
MITSEYRSNRATFPRAELDEYRGLWIAFASDGTRIIASGLTLAEADEHVRAAGEDPNEVVFERVPGPEDDICLGSEEFRSCFNSPTSTNP